MFDTTSFFSETLLLTTRRWSHCNLMLHRLSGTLYCSHFWGITLSRIHLYTVEPANGFFDWDKVASLQWASLIHPAMRGEAVDPSGSLGEYKWAQFSFAKTSVIQTLRSCHPDTGGRTTLQEGFQALDSAAKWKKMKKKTAKGFVGVRLCASQSSWSRLLRLAML